MSSMRSHVAIRQPEGERLSASKAGSLPAVLVEYQLGKLLKAV